MSALESSAPQEEASGGRKTFSWAQSVPMPSYLIAVAVGELESREISPRCVYVCVCVFCFVPVCGRTCLDTGGRGRHRVCVRFFLCVSAVGDAWGVVGIVTPGEM